MHLLPLLALIPFSVFDYGLTFTNQVKQDRLSEAGYFILQIHQPAFLKDPIVIWGRSDRLPATDWNL